MFIFGIYSYLENVFFALLNVCPQLIRKIIFKVILGRYEFSSYIDYGVYIRYPKKLYMGRGTSVNRGTNIFGSFFNKESSIRIGDNVAIGPNVIFFGAGHDYSKISIPDIGGSINVEDNVWIGGGSIILSGINIGKGSIVAAGSVVTKDVAPWTVVAGNPARFLKNRKID